MLVALFLLVVIALIGLAAIHSTVIEQHTAANQYDRELAFQSAEAALVVAQNAVVNAPGQPLRGVRDCRVGGVVCVADPFLDPNMNGYIHTVPDDDTGFNGNQLGAHQNLQYVIDDLGIWTVYDQVNGSNHQADANQYGPDSSLSRAHYYRITARSGNLQSGDRAVVTLQAIVRK